MPEPTSEKPRPSLDDTLRNIDAVLAEPTATAVEAVRHAADDIVKRATEAGLLRAEPEPQRGWLARALNRLFT